MCNSWKNDAVWQTDTIYDLLTWGTCNYLVVTERYVVTYLCRATAFILVMHKSQLSNSFSYNQANFELIFTISFECLCNVLSF